VSSSSSSRHMVDLRRRLVDADGTLAATGAPVTSESSSMTPCDRASARASGR
jgi:hypothetical protein